MHHDLVLVIVANLSRCGHLFFHPLRFSLAGNEVYLKSITIFKTHDFLVKPTIYFTCQGALLLPFKLSVAICPVLCTSGNASSHSGKHDKNLQFGDKHTNLHV